MRIQAALSLHAADRLALRSELMPVNDRYLRSRALIAACEAYHARKRRKVFIEYVILAGVIDAACSATSWPRCSTGGCSRST